MKTYKRLFAVTLLLLFAACSKENTATKIPYITPEESDGVTLKSSASFPWGAAVNVGLMKSNAAYRALVEKEMSSLTSENEMKMSRIRSSQTAWYFTDADYIVSFAQEHNIRIHGHTLIWHRSPAWLDTYQGDAAAWEAMFQEYIQTVVGRYKGKVA
ncbi:Endo-1,4-beta-xylanase A precursor [Arcticibacter svalbardensis MN12-7]|uniref:endo-1,4-beta-xylanase n=1 Tax=Arcticibacter svalbardensis MN12-7 TaxID=1150600 RepID=R9GWL2_9SPHI|nr:Endo-1,4-beta-xylanase A precursor [Arcticibacter svalbardensis MN12-7]